jgi:hypothetical protein
MGHSPRTTPDSIRHLTDYAKRSPDDMTLRELRMLSEKLKDELDRVEVIIDERIKEKEISTEHAYSKVHRGKAH